MNWRKEEKWKRFCGADFVFVTFELEQISELYISCDLEELDLSNDQLSELPVFLAELPSLKIIQIYGNPDLVVKNPGIYREKGIELVD